MFITTSGSSNMQHFPAIPLQYLRPIAGTSTNSSHMSAHLSYAP